MASQTVVDLDARFAPILEQKAASIKYIKVKLFGRDWRVSTEQNVFTALAGGHGDTEAILKLTRNVVHPDERNDFASTLMAQEGMDAETMLSILNALTEVAAGIPTKSPTGSPAGRKAVSTKRRTSAAR